MKEHLMAFLLHGSDPSAYRSALLEFHDNIKNANLFPLWSQHARNGYGSPELGFLPPVQLYLTELFYWISKSASMSMIAAVLMALLAGSIGAFFLLRLKFKRPEALLGATLYLFIPYLLKDVRILGALHPAFCFFAFPWMLYFALRCTKQQKPELMLCFSLACAAFAGSHAGVFLFALPICGLLVVLYRKKVQSIPTFIAAACIGFTCTAFYLSETILEAPRFEMNAQNVTDEKATDSIADLVKGRGDVLCARPSPTRIECDIMAIQHSSLRFNVYDYPGWRLVRDQATLAKKTDQNAKILVEIPPGKQHISAILKNTPLRTFTKILSIAALLSCFLFSFRNALLSKIRVSK